MNKKKLGNLIEQIKTPAATKLESESGYDHDELIRMLQVAKSSCNLDRRRVLQAASRTNKANFRQQLHAHDSTTILLLQETHLTEST
jgi:hypothetical protein